MRQSDSIANLAAALVRVQGRMAPVHKDRTNPGYRSRYATLDAITEAARPILAEEGVAVVQGGAEPVLNDSGVSAIVLETRLMHTSGEWLESAITIPLSKIDAQGVGSALTYARRYALSAAIGVTTDEDDDGNAASGPAKQRQPAKALDRRAAASSTHMPNWKEYGFAGVALKELPDAELERLQSWTPAKDPERYVELIRALKDEKKRRATTNDFAAPLPSEKDTRAPLPFDK